jgi:hypothetical protein
MIEGKRSSVQSAALEVRLSGIIPAQSIRP